MLLSDLRDDLFAEPGAIDHARRHKIDVDIVGPEFEREAFGHASQSPFGTGVGQTHRPPPHPEGAAHIDDLAAAAGLHDRGDGMDHVEGTQNIQAQNIVELLLGGLQPGLANWTCLLYTSDAADE